MSTINQLVPALVLAIAAFLIAALALVYSVYPLLPPHRLWKHKTDILSNKIPSPSNGAHIWIAIIEVISVSVFVWQAVMDEFDSQDEQGTITAVSAARMWFMVATRHVCMLLLSVLSAHVARHGNFAGWRKMKISIWAPLIALTLVGTGIAAIATRTQAKILPIGIIVFMLTASGVTSILLLSAFTNIRLRVEKKALTEEPRYPERKWSSYSTADIEILKEGPSWVTSYTSSQRPSISAFSFSTGRTVTTGANILTPEYFESPNIPKQALVSVSHSNTVGKSKDSSEKSSQVKLSGGTSSSVYYTADEYGKIQSGQATPIVSRVVSQTSWLTEPSHERSTISAWSFPTATATSAPSQGPSSATGIGSTRHTNYISPPLTAARSVDTLHMNGNIPSTGIEQIASLEAGLMPNVPVRSQPANSSNSSTTFRLKSLTWLAYVFLPPILALPYSIATVTGNNRPSRAASILFILAMTCPSFILALCICYCPFPFLVEPAKPTDDEFGSPCTTTFSVPPFLPTPSARSSADMRSRSRLHKRSGSATVSVFQVQRTDDVWLWSGDAMETKSQLKRVISLLAPKPRLSILPSTSVEFRGERKFAWRSEKAQTPREGDFVNGRATDITPHRYAEYVQRASELEIHMAVSDHGHTGGKCGSVRSIRSLDSGMNSSGRGARDYRSFGRLAGSIVEEESEANSSEVERHRREALVLIEARAASNALKDSSIHASREFSRTKNNFLKRVSPPSSFPVMTSTWKTSASFSLPEQVSKPKRTYKASRKESLGRRKRSSPGTVRPNKRVSFALEAKPFARARKTTETFRSVARRDAIAPRRRSDPAPSRIPVPLTRYQKISKPSLHNTASSEMGLAVKQQQQSLSKPPSQIPRCAPSSFCRPQDHPSATSQNRISSLTSGTSMSSFERGIPLAQSTPPPTLSAGVKGGASSRR